MPNFLGIGAQKCGSTWLYEILRRHERIDFPAGKEVHFWDINYHKGISWYSNLFSCDDFKIRGEITPAYAILKDDTIGIINKNFPELRLIYIIRNPISRAWSSAKMAIQRAEMTIDEASDQWFIDHFNSQGSLARGDYEKCIRSWRFFYSEEQLLILKYDLMKENPKIFIEQCLVHLGIGKELNKSMQLHLNDEIFPSEKIPIRKSIYKELLKIYSHKIDSLEEYLNEDLSSWKNEE